MPKCDISLEELQRDLENICKIPNREPGVFTAREMSERWGCHATRANRRIGLALEKGLIERARIYVLDNAGRHMPIPAYRILPKKKKKGK